MAKGNWRNWDEVECPNCSFRAYKKYYKNDNCPECDTKLIEVE